MPEGNVLVSTLKTTLFVTVAALMAVPTATQAVITYHFDESPTAINYGTGIVANYQFYFTSKKFLESDPKVQSRIGYLAAVISRLTL